MTKKFMSVILAFVTVLSSLHTVFADYTDLGKNSSAYDAIELLTDMKIFSGYSDGSFKPNKTLTRAEFAKLIVMICDKEKDAKFNSVISAFSDVSQDAWYVGYVNYISDQGIINGYADGNFRPEKDITFAEAVTVLCRLLGYTEETVGYYWPRNYMEQAKTLEITEGFVMDADSPITRGVAAMLIERVLFSEVYMQAASKNVILLETLGYTLYDNSFIMATGSDISSLTSKQVKTASGVYDVADGVDIPSPGEGGTLVINKDGKLTGIRKDEFASLTVYVTSMPDSNTVEYRTQDGGTGKYVFDSSFETYVNYNKLSYRESSSHIAVDTVITFCGDEFGEWEFAVIDNDTSGNSAMLASKDYTEDDDYIGNVLINKNNLQIYRDGESARLSDIRRNDVIYYNTKTNIIDVYSKKVSGIYKEAYPSKAYVTSVKVAGNTYNLSDTGAAKGSLGASNGSFNIGDRVTLLLGKNDKVEFAVELTDFNYLDYGVLLGCSQGMDDDGTSNMTAEIFMPDGSTYTCVVGKDYDSTLKGKLVHITYKNGIATLSAVSKSNLSGSLDVKNRKFAGKTVLKDVKVISRLSVEDASNVSVEVLDFDSIEVTELTSKQVINTVSANGFGDIGIMYLENMSGSYQYGFLLGTTKKGSGDNVTYTYKIFANGVETEYPNSARYNLSARTPVMFKTEGNSVSEIQSMRLIASASGYNAFDGGRIMINNSVYNLADEVQIIYVENSMLGNYKTISADELKSMNIDSISIYAQKSEGTNSLIRAIVVG